MRGLGELGVVCVCNVVHDWRGTGGFVDGEGEFVMIPSTINPRLHEST